VLISGFAPLNMLLMNNTHAALELKSEEEEEG